MSYYQQQPNIYGGQNDYQSQQQQSQPGQSPFYSGTSNSLPTGSMNFTNTYSDMAGSMMDQPLSTGIIAAFSTTGYPGEPSLLSELGINFSHIKGKTMAVLNPRASRISDEIANDADLSGPLIFCLLFGTFLLLAGKTHFGYIYGVALFGTISLHWLFKLMGQQTTSLDIMKTASVIGYCLLPLVIISGVAVFSDLDGLFGYCLAILCVCWCTYSASGFFVSVLKLENARVLIAYPLSMFYSVFALMAIFVEKDQLSSEL